MKSPRAQTPVDPDVYEEYQGWPSEVTEGLARYFLSAVEARPRRCLVLGAATGVNDALPLARAAAPGDCILAGDIEPAYLQRLRDRSVQEGLRNLDIRTLDVTQDLSTLGRFDLVSLLFVIHRLKNWEEVVDGLCRLVAPGGSFFVSEFSGPSGMIHLSNERGGRQSDPVSRLLRRYFELLPEDFAPALKSTSIAPVRSRLGESLEPMDHRDFTWRQTLTPAEVIRRIEGRAYAPFFSTHPTSGILDRLRAEFAAESGRRIELEETIRVFRFRKPQ